MKKLLYLLIFISYSSFSQEYGNTEDAIKLCSAIQSNNFSSDKSADNALERILGVIGASKRFVLQPCDNINNAVATSFKGIRYILYDRVFMNTIDSGTNWGNLFILAHEVGHHINGHSLDMLLYKSVEPKTLKQRRQQELEADEFAGFVLAKLGGSLDEANQLITSIADNSDDSFSTHPSRSKRLTAVGNGYKKATNNNKPIYSNNSTERTAEDYFYSGYSKANLKDYNGAITDYTKAIELNPNLTQAYYNRGHSKINLKDYNGAIADFTKAIELNPNNADAYSNRGTSKADLKDYYGAIADYTKAIELNPNLAIAYNNRGLQKCDLKDYYGAIADYTKAIELNPNNAKAYSSRGTSKAYLKDYYGAIADHTKAIKLNPNDAETYYNRAHSKANLKGYYGAIADYTKAIELNPNNADAYSNRGGSKENLEDYYGAIADYTKAIELNPNLAIAYNNRGVSKYQINDIIGACQDARKSKQLGYDASRFINAVCN
jgi:tetratricopeptide (TPR) repeat protein